MFRALLLVTCLISFAAGWQISSWQSNALLLKLELDIANEKSNSAQIEKQNIATDNLKTVELGHAMSTELNQEKNAARTINQEIIRYVEKPANSYSLPEHWVRIHDAAATGNTTLPEHSGTTNLSIGNTSHITNAQALSVIAANYHQCRLANAHLVGWQNWYHEFVLKGAQ